MTNGKMVNKSNKKSTDLVHRIIMPCAEVTHILSSSSSHSLSLRQRLALRVHLLVCGWCSRYKRQLARLQAALLRHPSDTGVSHQAGLSSEAREKIRRSLGEHQP